MGSLSEKINGLEKRSSLFHPDVNYKSKEFYNFELKIFLRNSFFESHEKKVYQSDKLFYKCKYEVSQLALNRLPARNVQNRTPSMTQISKLDLQLRA